jgi:hypothetical protein
MDTIAVWNGQSLAGSSTQEKTPRRGWKPVYTTRLVAVLAWSLSLTVMLRVVGIWNLMVTDNRVETRSHVEQEVAEWITKCPSLSAKAYVVACGTVQREVLKSESWVEAMIDDPGRPVDASLVICRFTLDSSGSIIAMSERNIPRDEMLR